MSKNDEFCIKNKKFCIKNEECCIKNDELCRTLLLPDPKTGRRGDSNITKSGADAWVMWNTMWYKKFDLSFTGFLINGTVS